MTKDEKYMAKIIFKNCIYKYQGQQFEDFFVDIMSKSNENFLAVKAHGNIGDRKNDGFDKKTGTYYQIFSPEDITKNQTIAEGVRKLENDFKGLYENWNDLCKIKEFYFAINDKFKGVPAPIHEMIIKLGEQYPDIKIELFSSRSLEKVFEQLDDEYMQEIVGYIPERINSIVEYSALSETIDYLINMECDYDDVAKLTVPDFDDKIAFNGLSAVVSNLLTTGGYQEGKLREYFNCNPGVEEALQIRFHALYVAAKEEVSDEQAEFADSRFFYILDKACAKKTMAIRNSVIVLMSVYFASCDIFEEPDKATE